MSMAKANIMAFKTNVRVNIKTTIKCPRCMEKFDKPSGEDASIQCPYCGVQLKLSTESIEHAMREAEAKVAEELKSARVPVPQQYAGNSGLKRFTAPLNIIGVASTVWACFFPIPYNLAVIACALVPASAIFAMWFLKRTAFDRIKVNDQLNMSVKEGMLGIPWFIIQKRT